MHTRKYICVLVSALVMFSVVPDTFNNFFDAFYWAVITLTTVGYGDVYPNSDLGRVVSMISAIVGIVMIILSSFAVRMYVTIISNQSKKLNYSPFSVA